MATSVVRSLAGFHVIKLLEFKDPNNGVVVQRHARHILLKAEKGQAESQAAAPEPSPRPHPEGRRLRSAGQGNVG